ncbi:MAG: Fe-S cluster assembly protein SufD [Paracoccaceae bacterium]
MAVAAHKTEGAATLLARYAAPKPLNWLKGARDSAADRLSAMGAPHGRDEYWRYTPPAPLLGDVADVAAVQDAPLFDADDAYTLVFVDGVFDAAQSKLGADPALSIQTLNAANADIHWAAESYGVLENAGQNPVPRPLAALNTATAEQGVLIRVSGKAAKPVLLRHIRKAANAEAMLHHVIKLDAGASLTLLEDGVIAARSNVVLEVDVADGAAFDHMRNQGRDHGRVLASHIFAKLGAQSQFKSFTLSLNGALSRNEAVITMTGDSASAHIAGAAVGDGAFLHDDTIFITHDAEHCESRQVFKKVLRNGANGVFQGKILVKPGAQKTDGYQISQGLLLDDDSNFLAKPELEIYADDVVCSHGSTCGSVDETALFYLTSRGVSKADAQDLLVLAFLDEAIAEIRNDDLADLLRERLGGWLARRRK